MITTSASSATAPSLARPLSGLRRRSARLGPVRAAGALAARNPQAAMVLGAGLLIGFGMLVLLIVSSIQAFMVLSGQSTLTADRQTAALVLQAATGGEEGRVAASGSASTGAAGSGVGATSAHPTAPVGQDEVVSIEGIRVHVSIADDIRALLAAAEADGIPLSGWGWRDTQAQIRLRRQHCGTSQYAIYQMPSGQCRPPTARPGSSQHERGLAIDFTYAGGSISSHRNAGYRWLAANAATYGLKNLPSEPWHWSTTGR